MNLLLSCAFALASVAPQADVHSDERLKAAVTIEASVKSVKDILDDLSQRTGVSLRVQDTLREDLVVLYAKERPAHEILARIATHFGWEWRQSNNGYMLSQSADAAARERRELEQQILEPFHKAKKQAQEYLQSFVPQEIERVQSEIVALRKQLIDRKGAEGEDYYRLYSRLLQLSEKISPEAMLEAMFVAQMTDQEYFELERLGKLVYSTNPTALQRPMPRAIVERLPSLLYELSQRSGNTGPIELGADPNVKIELFKPEEVRVVRAILKRRSVGMFAFLSGPDLDVSFQFLGEDGSVLHRASGSALAYTFSATESEEPEESPKSERPQGLPARFEEAWSPPETIKKLVLATSGEDAFLASDLFSKMFGSSDPLRLFGDTLIEFAKAMNVCLLADAYDAHILGGYGTGLAADSAALFLDSMTGSMGAKWSYAEPWVMIRTAPYALARASTVPRSVLNRILGEKGRIGGITFDTFSSAMVNLTDRQATSPAMLFAIFAIGGAFGSGEMSLPAISFCRMWGSMPPALQETLKQGRTVRRDLLPSDTRAHLDRYLYLVEDEPLQLSLYLDDSISARLVSMMADVPGRRDDEFTQRFPTGAPPGTEIYLEYGAQNGLEVQLAFGGQVAFSTIMSVDGFGMVDMFEDDQVAFSGFKVANLERYRFQIALTPSDTFTVQAGGATSDQKAAFVPFDSLPAELRQQIEQAKERARRRWNDPPPPGG